MNPLLALLLRLPLHGLGLFVATLPRSLEMTLGRSLGRLLLLVDPKRRRIAEENMRLCLPELSARERERVLRENYEHYGILILELSHMFTPWRGHWPAYVERVSRPENIEHWSRARARGKGILFMSGHFANWEIMSAVGGLADDGPVAMVTRRLKPAWLHDWMVAVRAETRCDCILQPRTLPGVMKVLRAGQSTGFVLDQYMPPPMGEPMRFFGARVDTLAATVPLARRTGAGIVPVQQIREPDGTLRVVFLPEFVPTGDDKADSQALVDMIEAWIRERPAQWLWVHRRFKHAVWPAAREPERQHA